MLKNILTEYEIFSKCMFFIETTQINFTLNNWLTATRQKLISSSIDKSLSAMVTCNNNYRFFRFPLSVTVYTKIFPFRHWRKLIVFVFRHFHLPTIKIKSILCYSIHQIYFLRICLKKKKSKAGKNKNKKITGLIKS